MATKAQLAAAAAEVEAIRAARKSEAARKAAATRAANKAAAVAAPAPVAAHVEAVQPQPAAASVEDMINDMQLPSAKRVLVGFVLGVAAACAASYGIGMIAAYALAGVMTLTASAWITFALSVIVWILAIYAGWKISGYVGGKVFSSVVMPDGLASRSYESVSNWFGGAKEKAVVAYDEAKATVNGAFTKAKVAA